MQVLEKEMFSPYLIFVIPPRSNAANKLSKKRYKVRWCVPVVEVDVMDVGSGIMVNIDNKTTTTIKYTHPGKGITVKPSFMVLRKRVRRLKGLITCLSRFSTVLMT